MENDLENPPSYVRFENSNDDSLPSYGQAVREKIESMVLIQSQREERDFLLRHKPPGTRDLIKIQERKGSLKDVPRQVFSQASR